MKTNLIVLSFVLGITAVSPIVFAQATIEETKVSTMKNMAGGDQSIASIRLDADRGDAIAQTKLGVLYATGKGVEQDYAEAFRWFHLAADQGFAQAQLYVGNMYSHGKGVTENFQEAVKWYRSAADHGESVAQRHLAEMYLLGNGLPKNDTEAAKWFHVAANNGDAISQCQLGLMYAIGKGVPQDDKEASKWLQLAADQGDAVAKSKLPLLPMYKAVSDAVDKGFENRPPQDATSARGAVTLMKAAIHDADYVRTQCIRLDPDLQAEIDLNLSHWKTIEAHAVETAETQWSSMVQKQPETAQTLNRGDSLLQLAVDTAAKSSNGKGLQFFCTKYFVDLASGIWRKRTPELYAFLDSMP